MVSRKIAVLGGGNGAHCMAADMKLKGHTVKMFEFPEFKHNMQRVFDTQTVIAKGAIPNAVNGVAKLDLVTDDIDAAVSDAEIILLVCPAFAHEHYAEALKGHVNKDQIIVTFPGAFAALVIKKVFGDAECPALADANNLPYDARILEPGVVTCFGRTDMNIGYFPATCKEKWHDILLDALFPFQRVYESVLESGLSIVNPAWHTGSCLFNVSNIERPEFTFYLYQHGWTPSACKLDMVLDQERKDIGAALGYDLHPVEDFGKMEPHNYTWEELYRAGHGDIALTPICGPNDIWNRYLTEDCPFGLVPWASIAEVLGVPVPMTNSCIDIYNVIHDKDWRKEGLTADDMGLTGMTRDEIVKYVRTGEK
ncbi:MAG: NAD/NADP octopine/nopaline dehydrogenase family protein [Firmicutes bacterium]|nr:NAD/NADP octopine/nopaline dehydrogenase family protein [Bacillota bacterium]MCR4709764.1 NAD/NADP octopine/nopaline dehydrogenase family protein [Clostridiales bacterium]